MNDQAAYREFPAAIASRPRALPWELYWVEALASSGTNLLVTAIYFYTKDRYNWTLKQNFLLATGQGIVYIAGAMGADSIAGRLTRQRALAFVYALMALLALTGMLAAQHPAAVAALLLAYSFSSSVGWPMIESLVSSDVDSETLSRRQSVYNLVWSIVGVVMVAVAGTIIKRWPAWMFLLPAIVHGISCMLMLRMRRDQIRPSRASVDNDDGVAATLKDVGMNRTAGDELIHAAASHLDPEPELLRMRTLALWLSRVALPATYVVIFSLMALMPSLPIMQTLDADKQTLISCTWMVTRTLMFVALGLTAWWHTRPRLLLIAAIVMVFAFFAVTIRPSDVLGHGSFAIDMTTMIVAQLALGAALGMIYSASLYFGMVLSEGSTEHGGYHEALIGVGFVLGPGAGVLAQIVRPDNVYAGIAAVGGVVCLSVIAVGITAIMGARKDPDVP